MPGALHVREEHNREGGRLTREHGLDHRSWTGKRSSGVTYFYGGVRVLYLQATDNSSGSQSSKIVSFHHRERGRCHGTELVVLPAPIGRSRVHLPRHPCLVARPSQGHISQAPQAGQAPTNPLQSPKPFTGFIHKPLCEACEQGADSRPKAPGAPPPLLTFPRGRRRTVNTPSHFCPDPDCAYHGWLGRGNIRANGHPGGQP
jgi:hypothetical protein